MGKLYGDKDVVGGPSEVGHSIDKTNDGGYIITGSKFGDKGWDVYLVKIDSVGQMQWSNSYNGPNGDEYRPSWERGFDVLQTSDGGYIVAGETTEFQSSDNNIYVVKTNGTGAFEWDYSYGGLNGNAAYSVEETAEGYVIGGYCRSNTKALDFCLINLNKAGGQISFIDHGLNDKNYGRGMTKTLDGGNIISGTTYMDGLNRDRQVYIVKFLNGSVQWERTFGGSGEQESYTIEETADGGFIIAGYAYILSEAKMYLIKTNSEGRVLTELDISSIDLAIKAANTARVGARISYENGKDVEPDTLWVTYADDQALSAEILKASSSKDSVKSIQEVENEVSKLNTAIATYNSKKAFGTKGVVPAPVSKITVTSDGGATTITTPKGTLQMLANVEPLNAGNKSVTWSIADVTTAAAISIDGLLTAQSNGSARVRATASDGSGVFGEMVVEISGQVDPVETILINSAEDLKAISQGLDKHYKLNNDIDLSSITDGWIPIGSIIDEFTGTFDGNGYKVLNFNKIHSTAYDDCVGLFGVTGKNAVIKNVVLKDVTFTSGTNSRAYIAGLVGHNKGSIANSHVQGIPKPTRPDIYGKGYVGGLVGYNEGVIINSSAEVWISCANSNAGGLAGSNSGSIQESYATGKVEGNGTNVMSVGGLVGLNHTEGIIQYSYATGEVKASQQVGGLVGSNMNGTIKNSYASGDVYGKYSGVGGLVGSSYGGRIQNSQARNKGIYNNLRDPSTSMDEFGRIVGKIENTPTPEEMLILIDNYAYDMSYFYYEFNMNDSKWELCNKLFTTNTEKDQKNGADLPQNKAPTAAAVTVTGTPMVGEVLTGTYTYNDEEDDREGLSTFRWLSSGTAEGEYIPITEETSKTLILNQEQLGKYIKFEVTPVALEGVPSGIPGMSIPIGPVIEKEADIILIRTVEELKAINQGLDKHYKLANDIALTSDNWVPLGSLSKRFSGTFDGDGHIITGLTIKTFATYGMYEIGLFGVTSEKAVIKNVGVESVEIGEYKYNFAGCLVGTNYGHISNSYSSGNITGDNVIGGLVGGNYGTMESSYSSAVVGGKSIVTSLGGLIGTNCGTVKDCYATGEVKVTFVNNSPSGESMGGLVGANSSNGIILYSHATGRVEGKDKIGGLVGYNSQATIEDCYATGDVHGSDYVGGLVGCSVQGRIENSNAKNTNIFDNHRAVDRTSLTSDNFRRVVGFLDKSPTLINNYAYTMTYNYYVWNEETNVWDVMQDLDHLNTETGPDQRNGADLNL